MECYNTSCVWKEGIVGWEKVVGGKDWDDVLWECGEDIVSTLKVLWLLLETRIVYNWRRLYWKSEDWDGEDELKLMNMEMRFHLI